MPIYMDRHNTEGLTREDIVASHVKDLAIQGRYGVRFITYWHDEVTSKAFCLVEAPNKDAIQKVHDEAHGGIPNEIIEVEPAVVEAFLEESRIRLRQIQEARRILIRPRVRSCLPICRTRLA